MTAHTCPSLSDCKVEVGVVMYISVHELLIKNPVLVRNILAAATSTATGRRHR